MLCLFGKDIAALKGEAIHGLELVQGHSHLCEVWEGAVQLFKPELCASRTVHLQSGKLEQVPGVGQGQQVRDMIQVEMRQNCCIYITHVNPGLAQAEQRSRPTVEEQWLLALYQNCRLGAPGLGNSHAGAKQGDPKSHAIG